MKRFLVCVVLIVSTNTFADVIQLNCSSDKVISIYRVGDTTKSREEVNELRTLVSINLSKSEIKISCAIASDQADLAVQVLHEAFNLDTV